MISVQTMAVDIVTTDIIQCYVSIHNTQHAYCAVVLPVLRYFFYHTILTFN